MIRQDLSDAERSEQLWKRKKIYEALHPETRAGAAGAHAKHGHANEKSSSADATAAATGRTARSVQIDAKRAREIGEDLPDIAGTSLDKGVELDALAAMPAEECRPLIYRATGTIDSSA